MNLAALVTSAWQVFVSGTAFTLICALIFWPLEELFEGPKAKRPKLSDIAYLWFYQSYGLWIGAGAVFAFAYKIRDFMPQQFLARVNSQPLWLQIGAALLMAEIWVYCFHRLAHSWEPLWKFHRVHHTLVDMTWSAASRHHPIDFFLTVVGANLPAMLLGIDLRAVATFLLLERLYTVFLHSDLKVSYGWFGKILASPRLHATHHDPLYDGKNFAGVLSLLDVIAGTYMAPPSNDIKTRPLDSREVTSS